MRIVFIGCVKSSEIFLKAVHRTSAEIVGVVTKSISNFNADHVSLIPFCKNNSIPYLDYNGNDELLAWVNTKKPDLIYCFGWSYLLPKKIIDYPSLGSVGYHPALLPKNRGRHPIIWAIALGLKETGSTFFYLTEEADAGNILNQRKILIDNDETSSTLYNKLMKVGEQQVIEMTEAFLNNSISFTVQEESKASYWRKRNKNDGKIDWRMNGETIYRLVNALTKPYAGAHFEYNNQDIIVWKIKYLLNDKDRNIEPGKIISVNENSFTVKVADGLVEILEYSDHFIPVEGEYL